MRSSLELSEVRLHLSIAHSIVGFLGRLDGSHLLVSLTAQFSWTIHSFDEEVMPSMGGPGLSATYCLVWRCFEHWWPLGSIQWQCLGLQIVECLIHCMWSDWFYGVESSWLAICSDMTGEQLGKDTKWHNITICTVVDFASEASTMIWAYFSRHFSEYINVDCSGVDKDFITLRITVIAYINTVGLPFFYHCVHIGVASCLDPSV